MPSSLTAQAAQGQKELESIVRNHLGGDLDPTGSVIFPKTAPQRLRKDPMFSESRVCVCVRERERVCNNRPNSPQITESTRDLTNNSSEANSEQESQINNRAIT